MHALTNSFVTSHFYLWYSNQPLLFVYILFYCFRKYKCVFETSNGNWFW